MLRRLASLYGIQPSYWSRWGEHIEAPVESLLAVLRALGAIESLGQVPDALRQKEEASWYWTMEPVLVAWDGYLRDIEVRIPEWEAEETADCRIELEDGETLRWQQALHEARVAGGGQGPGMHCESMRFECPFDLPDGYHRLYVEIDGERMTSLVISAPRISYQSDGRREEQTSKRANEQSARPRNHAKKWGVFLPLYATHSARSWGIGDLTDLGTLVDWAGRKGASFVGTLPLLASFLDKPYAPSPYTPVSRLFWNEVYIDPERSMPAGAAYEVDAESAAKAHQLTNFEEVPYRAAMGVKRHVLEEQTRVCLSQPGLAEQFERYIADKPRVAEYAAFRAAVERLGPSWRDWPEEPRLGRPTPDDFDADTSNYYAFAQWRLDAQMRELEQRSHGADVRLYLDLPVGVHADGYDAWRYRDLFVRGLSVGAPPDLLSLEGQNWGFEPLNPLRQRETGYEYMRTYLAHHLSVAGMLRVDHAIGLHRMFWIPWGASGRDGVFMRQHADELYAVLSLESHRHRAVLVGENLGLVPPEVDEGLREHRIAGMYVQRFSLTGDPAQCVEAPPEDAVVCFGTHDTPPFAAFWTDEDMRQRARAGLDGEEAAAAEIEGRQRERQAMIEYLQDRGMLGEQPTTEEVYLASTKLLAESDAEWLLINLEDTWGETHSQNVPGTLSEQHPNWSFRAAHALEELDDIRETTETVEAVRSLRPKGQKEQPRAIQEGGASS